MHIFAIKKINVVCINLSSTFNLDEDDDQGDLGDENAFEQELVSETETHLAYHVKRNLFKFKQELLNSNVVALPSEYAFITGVGFEDVGNWKKQKKGQRLSLNVCKNYFGNPTCKILIQKDKSGSKIPTEIKATFTNMTNGIVFEGSDDGAAFDRFLVSYNW